jgi:hypothetical protein
VAAPAPPAVMVKAPASLAPRPRSVEEGQRRTRPRCEVPTPAKRAKRQASASSSQVAQPHARGRRLWVYMWRGGGGTHRCVGGGVACARP